MAGRACSRLASRAGESCAAGPRGRLRVSVATGCLPPPHQEVPRCPAPSFGPSATIGPRSPPRRRKRGGGQRLSWGRERRPWWKRWLWPGDSVCGRRQRQWRGLGSVWHPPWVGGGGEGEGKASPTGCLYHGPQAQIDSLERRSGGSATASDGAKSQLHWGTARPIRRAAVCFAEQSLDIYHPAGLEGQFSLETFSGH